MGLGDWVSGLFGSDNQKTFHMDPTKVDPNAYQYGGQAGGAAAAAGQYGKTATDAQGRQGVQLGTGQMDQSRGQQEDALNNLRGAANGTAPSVAQGQMQQGLNSSILAQGSAAASARGPAAMGAAQYGAAANSAAQSQAAVGQAANLRASEMAQARGEYMGAASGIRGQDFQQSATQAQLEAQQRAQNDQMQLGMTGDQIAVNNSQLQAQEQGQAQQSANDLGVQGLNLRAAQGADEQNASGAASLVGLGAAGLAVASGGASAAVPSDENMKTGVAPEGGALGFGMPGGVGVGRTQSGLTGTPTLGGGAPYLGAMSMSPAASGYSPNAPAPPAPASNPAAQAKPLLGQEGSDLAKLIALSGATGDSKKDPMGSGMRLGTMLFGSMKKKADGGSPSGAGGGVEVGGASMAPGGGQQNVGNMGMFNMPGDPGAYGASNAGAGADGSLGASIGGIGDLSDARAKQDARAEGVREGMAAVSALFTPNGQPVASGRQDPAAMMQTNEQPTHHAPPRDGMLAQGNIDLTRRPVVKNPDGSISTVRSMGVNIDGKEVLIPTVSDDGRIMSNEEAIHAYQKTGRHLGMFSSPAASTAYAQKLHEEQAREYALPAAPSTTGRGDPEQSHSQAPQHAAPAQMLDQLQPVSYNYKPGVGEDPNKRRYGIIAQDLARTPMGASTLVRRPDGMLAIDPRMATGVHFANEANLHQRVRELEARQGEGQITPAEAERFRRNGLGISKLTGGR